MRLADWPRMPYLNDEVRDWMAQHLATLRTEDVAVFAVAGGRDDEARRILVVTEPGLLDAWYAPQESTARYGLALRLHPWSMVSGVDLRAQTTRLWARENRTAWVLTLDTPRFEARTEDVGLGSALAEFAAACAVMAGPAGGFSGAPPPDELELPEWLTRRQQERPASPPVEPRGLPG